MSDRWAYQSLIPPEPPRSDRWIPEANNHLLAYIFRTMHKDSRRYGDPKFPSDEMKRATAILVRYKNAWAQDMREAQDAQREVNIAFQQSAWKDCMARAEGEISVELPRNAA
jgi:hypothetical protein